MPRAQARAEGFTLIEVLAALLIVSLVFGLLLESVTTNLANIGRARLEARSMELAEQRARELEIQIASGELIEDGETEGVYEEPDQDLRWHISVSARTLDLPADYPKEQPPSPLFALAGSPPPTPAVPGEPPAPLRLVEVRVYGIDADPDSVDPFVLLVTAPPDAARLAQLQQQRQQAIPQTDGGVETPQ
jgi:prepilin-type N-terminal cleavage/methylation domain-containing protein